MNWNGPSREMRWLLVACRSVVSLTFLSILSLNLFLSLNGCFWLRQTAPAPGYKLCLYHLCTCHLQSDFMYPAQSSQIVASWAAPLAAKNYKQENNFLSCLVSVITLTLNLVKWILIVDCSSHYKCVFGKSAVRGESEKYSLTVVYCVYNNRLCEKSIPYNLLSFFCFDWDHTVFIKYLTNQFFFCGNTNRQLPCFEAASLVHSSVLTLLWADYCVVNQWTNSNVFVTCLSWIKSDLIKISCIWLPHNNLSVFSE